MSSFAGTESAVSVKLKSLIGKLNATCRNALEDAAELCQRRTNYDVDLEHLFLKLTEVSNSDLSKICRHFEIDTSRLARDLTHAIDRMKTGNARSPALSPRIVKLLTQAWTIGSVDYGTTQVRSGILLVALLATDELARLARESSAEFQRISAERLRNNLLSLTANSIEDVAGTAASAEESAGPEVTAPEAPVLSGKTPSLDQFTIDITAAARKGAIDPVLGRDFEIRQIIDILTRRRQNNPILTGEAGVGKTAVVEGFALRVAVGDVPSSLKNVQVRTLDLGLLQAGAGVKGEFENRLKSVIAEVKASLQPIILFIDEAHTMIGAGGQAGQSDAANLLKPALARGELRTIAATTWSEYKKYFEKDAALARRFQVIKVEEPSERQAVVMLRGLANTLETHHKARVLDEAVEAAVRLSHRYISGRQLPDKAVSVLDTACARVAIGQTATPAAIEDCQRTISQIETETRVLERESAVGGNHSERLAQLASESEAVRGRLAELEKRLETERALIKRILEVREKIEARLEKEPMPQQIAVATAAGAALPLEPAVAEGEVGAYRDELGQLTAQLGTVQGESPLVQFAVDSQIVAEVISGWTGIPVGKMMKDEINTVLNLKNLLEERVVGQSHALESISHRIRTARAGLDDPRRPVGVFLLVGPSGVGKTETALALADALYGGERNLVTINMSEYQEAHTISGLKGSPPGYVGYGEGGVLTEAVRRKPYCVVLLDEMEKAHTDVMELFYQVFDKGFMEDAEGREVDFKNTVILMTSNAGSDMLMKMCADPDTRPNPAALSEALGPELRKIFKPALLGRLIVIPYYPIDDGSMRKIIELKLNYIRRRLEENHRIPFTYSTRLVDEVARRCTEVESGARNVDHILTGTLLPEISSEILARMADGLRLNKVHVTVEGKGALQYEIN
jgi:type VI secretion system protein VasG